MPTSPGPSQSEGSSMEKEAGLDPNLAVELQGDRWDSFSLGGFSLFPSVVHKLRILWISLSRKGYRLTKIIHMNDASYLF